jgi:hypothetical protein
MKGSVSNLFYEIGKKLTPSGLEQVSCPKGLARVKDYDRRFAFYPSFSVKRSLALEYRAQSILRLSLEIQALQSDLKAGNISDSSNLDKPGMLGKRLEGIILYLIESLV